MGYKFLTGIEKWAEELYQAICSVSESRTMVIASKSPITFPSIEKLSKPERSMLKAQYEKYGICLFASNSVPDRTNGHPLFQLVEQLRDDDWLNFPMRHPLEGHPESVKRFGPNDNTFKIYNLSKSPEEGYIEVAETSAIPGTSLSLTIKVLESFVRLARRAG
ncbi:hypothetical protein FJZ33_06985 [Candidatus Poribacteria bacterium]|nr:hypothetical protein [Candidatus Poribacteria bacterium]